ELYQDGIAPTLVVTGGKAAGDRTTEAEAARGYAMRHGVEADDILVEDESRTTLASIHGVSALMDEHELESALFVSDPTHMLRVLRMAADAGIDARGSPTMTSPIEQDTAAWVDAVAHEVGGLGVYFVTGTSP
ncbi:MAG TPA: YdcF family protein, partial [Candidatus Saccharimonadales bacterium]|nr:YdcF family protein [Candidatus Saccharimonadales bacterium]